MTRPSGRAILADGRQTVEQRGRRPHELTPKRRLAAIMAADIVGYARLVETDEAGTLEAVRSLWRDLLVPLARERHGRVVKSMGDGAIVEFSSVVEAVDCAVTLQQAAAARQAQIAPERRIVHRIGINLGDVVVEGQDLLGDGVIVAARLEQLCEPGGGWSPGRPTISCTASSAMRSISSASGS